MNAIVKMTGPHAGAVSIEGRPRAAWRVALVEPRSRKPQGKVYLCLSYRRAISLACLMAHDRKLYLHMEALPR